jgi:hypothetical protein
MRKCLGYRGYWGISSQTPSHLRGSSVTSPSHTPDVTRTEGPDTPENYDVTGAILKGQNLSKAAALLHFVTCVTSTYFFSFLFIYFVLSFFHHFHFYRLSFRVSAFLPTFLQSSFSSLKWISCNLDSEHMKQISTCSRLFTSCHMNILIDIKYHVDIEKKNVDCGVLGSGL